MYTRRESKLWKQASMLWHVQLLNVWQRYWKPNDCVSSISILAGSPGEAYSEAEKKYWKDCESSDARKKLINLYATLNWEITSLKRYAKHKKLNFLVSILESPVSEHHHHLYCMIIIIITKHWALSTGKLSEHGGFVFCSNHLMGPVWLLNACVSYMISWNP